MSEDNTSQYSSDAPDEGGSGATITDHQTATDSGAPDPTALDQAASAQLPAEGLQPEPEGPDQAPAEPQAPVEVDAAPEPALTIPEPPP